jgi:iron complex outermembrane receptor protein
MNVFWFDKTWRATGVFATLASASLLFPYPIFGQTSGELSGSVRDAGGTPVAGAQVRVLELRRETRSDAQGVFAFPAVPAGTYLVEASREGRGHGVERVTVTPGAATSVELVLLAEAHAEEIVVTASPLLASQLELAQPTTVLDGDELAAAVQPSLGETLAGQAGIASTYFGPGASRPVIRGLGGDRVRTLEDGVGSLDVSALSPDHAVSAEPLQAERIEVVRGPATLLYGSNAIGGVVNLFDGRIPDFPPSESVEGNVTLLGGTVADERTGSLDLTGGGAAWAWSLGALRRETDDYEIPGHAEVEGLDEGEEEEEEEEHVEAFGVLANSDIETTSGRLGLSRFFSDRGFLGVAVSGLDTNYGIPGGHAHEEGEEEGGEAEEEGEGGGIRIDMEQRRADLRSEMSWPSGAFRGFRARVGVANYEHAELEPSGEIGTRFLNDAWEARFELVQRQREAWNGSFGLQAGKRDLEALGEEAFIPPTETGNLALFTFQEFDRGTVRYQLGARVERQEVDTPSPELPDRSFDGVSASFGIVASPAGPWSFGGSLSRAVKAPSAEELFSNGAHAATQTFEIGDPDLGEETGLGLDLFVRRDGERFDAELRVFGTEFSDFIFPAFTGEEEDGFDVVLYSQAEAEFTGAELETRFEVWEGDAAHVDLRLMGDVVRGELADDGGNLPRIPPPRVGVGLDYHGAHWTAGAEVRDVQEQDRVALNETPTEGYTMVDAEVGYRFFLGDSVLDLLLRGRNLTDEEARNHVSYLKDQVPLPGEDASLVARFVF